MTLKKWERMCVAFLLFCATFSWTGRLFGLELDRVLSVAGLLFALSGFIQLDHAGFFDGSTSWIDYKKISEAEGDSTRPIRSKIRNVLFFNGRTGFALIITGTILQIGANFF